MWNLQQKLKMSLMKLQREKKNGKRLLENSMDHLNKNLKKQKKN